MFLLFPVYWFLLLLQLSRIAELIFSLHPARFFADISWSEFFSYSKDYKLWIRRSNEFMKGKTIRYKKYETKFNTTVTFSKPYLGMFILKCSCLVISCMNHKRKHFVVEIYTIIFVCIGQESSLVDKYWEYKCHYWY